MPKRTFPELGDLFQNITYVRAEEQFPSAEAAFQSWAADCMSLPDPIERGEARAEAAYDEVTAGQPDGKWKCPDCDQVRGLNDMYPASADPYSSPVCGACIEKMYPGAFDHPPGGTMPDETNDVYNLYDLTMMDPSQPGDVETIRVRSRSETGARNCAAAHSGREGRETWKDPARSTCKSYGPAHVQWAGVVSLRAHGSRGEGLQAG